MIRKKMIVGEGSKYPLRGLLTLPDDLAGPVPAVVMVHGSGPSDLDERVMKLTPFKDLAEGLAKHGVASLRYDKRTFAYARKMARLRPTVEEETIEDALRAIGLLKKDARIDRDRIYLLGHSMGAMLAPRIDAEGGDVKGLILLAGTPYRLEEVVLRQLKQTAGSRSVLRGIVKLEYKLYSRKFSGLYQMSDAEAKKKTFAGNLSLYYFKEMGRKTAGEYLLESRKPVLLLQGGKDFQVLAEDDFRKFREILAGRDNTCFKCYPSLNHVFVEGMYDDILMASKEYGVERHVPEEVPEDIAAFIAGTASFQ